MNHAVHTEEVEPGIFVVRLQDRASGNAFSDALIVGLLETFARLGQNESCKVVILTGVDSYFATGGTREGLLALHEGKGSFADTNLYSLALDLPVPVIAAMQGHGIGGGLVMGLYADVVVLSRESVYATNFMNYGFTPGMGATCIVPRKMGLALAEEMLFSGRNYRGEELKQRGVSFAVLPRAEVFAHALELARSIAEKPRVSLIALKDLLVAGIRQELPATVKREQEMHSRTFHLREVKENIQARFGPGAGVEQSL
jgi:polyketide biosynthesis enoyl-CoA hydratase PksI